jgi:hypothetical protein
LDERKKNDINLIKETAEEEASLEDGKPKLT